MNNEVLRRQNDVILAMLYNKEMINEETYKYLKKVDEEKKDKVVKYLLYKLY